MTKQQIKTTFTFTENEKNFLLQVINYDNAESQLNDNYSNAGMEEAIDLMGSKHAAAGLIGSLVAKEVGEIDEDYDQFIIFEDAIREVYKAIGK